MMEIGWGDDNEELRMKKEKSSCADRSGGSRTGVSAISYGFDLKSRPLTVLRDLHNCYRRDFELKPCITVIADSTNGILP